MKQKDRLIFELQKYIFGEISLNEFQDWFVPYTWLPPKSVRELSHSIDHQLAGFTSGITSEIELKETLRKELDNLNV
jgi:hypothetical protein